MRSSKVASGYAWQGYHSAEEGIVIAKKNGYDYWYIDGSVHDDFVTEWSEDRIDKMNELISEYGVKPIFHGNFKAPLACDVESLRQASVEYVKKEIELCSKLSAPLIIHGSVIVEPRLVAQAKKIAIEQYLKSINELNEYADRYNVEIMLENLSNYPQHRPFHYIFTLQNEFEFILSHVKNSIFFDIGHAYVNAEVSIEKIIEKFGSRIAAISVSNNDGKRDLHNPIHVGEMNYRSIVATLINTGWKGLVGFETRSIDPLDSRNQFIDLCLEVDNAIQKEEMAEA